MSCRACQAVARERAEFPSANAGHRAQARVRPPPYGVDVTDRTIVQRKCEGNCDRGERPRAPTVNGNGKPLDPKTRHFFEAHLGRDLRAVRIHTDDGAATAARGIGARAFTIGPDISFGRGEFRPKDPDGKHLLAHELAHVVQQSGGATESSLVGVQRDRGLSSDAFEREADLVADRIATGIRATPQLRAKPAVQRQPLSGSLLDEEHHLRPPEIPPPPLFRPGSVREAWVIPEPPALPELEIPEPRTSFQRRHQPVTPTLTLDPALRFSPVTIIPVPRCVPDRALTWADFPGRSVPRGASAVTRVVMPQIIVDGNPMFQAQLKRNPPPAVLPRIVGLGARATNGCARLVAQCQREINSSPRGWTSRSVPNRCPASVFTSQTASSFDECESIIGTSCDADAIQESNRLLAHEQLHFDIACLLVGRANDALIAGSHSSTQLRPWLIRTFNQQTRLYDGQSQNGCIPQRQAAWEADVANGLPSVRLPQGRP